MGTDQTGTLTTERRGRRTRLTPEIQDRIITLVTAGHYKRVAAAQAGVSERTLYQWYEKGDPEHPGHRKVYGQFRQALDKAEADSEMVLLDKVVKIGTGRDLLEVLARRFPERWARRVEVGVQGDPRNPIRHDHEHSIAASGTGGRTVTAAVQIVIEGTDDTWQPNDDPAFLEAPATLIETTTDTAP